MRQTKGYNKKFFTFGLGILLTAFCLGLGGCGQPTVKATYELELQGAVEESGVISYAGLEMNVYKNINSNPCGSCAAQPVSVYAGATDVEVAKAMAEAITRADDIGTVKELDGSRLLLEEKNIGEATKPEAPEAPAGLTVKDTFTKAH